MQDPVREIKTVISDLVASASPDTQKAAVYGYYTPNAGFRNPFARVDPGPLSRERILGLWQWCRILSPKASVHVENVVYDKPHNTLLVDVAQQFHPFFSPLGSVTSRALIRLTLTVDNGYYFIAFQEDFYDAEGTIAMICPPVASLAGFTLRTVASISNLLAKSFQVLNYWRPKKTGGVYDEEPVHSCQKSNGHVEHNKKSGYHKEKTAPGSNNIQHGHKQGPTTGVDGDTQPRHEYGKNPYAVVRDGEGQVKYWSGTSALSDDMILSLNTVAS